ncbi:hypothetical protein BGZ76_005425, partial [Entomortierella beljakovae]
MVPLSAGTRYSLRNRDVEVLCGNTSASCSSADPSPLGNKIEEAKKIFGDLIRAAEEMDKNSNSQGLSHLTRQAESLTDYFRLIKAQEERGENSESEAAFIAPLTIWPSRNKNSAQTGQATSLTSLASNPRVLVRSRPRTRRIGAERLGEAISIAKAVEGSTVA